MIAVVTDSNSMLPDDIAAALGITVVPLPVMLDGVAYLEGVDLDADEFYERVASGAVVTTSQPSPGEIAAAYEQAVVNGASAIVSVHVAKHLSGTINSARIAKVGLSVPVELIDSGAASFPIGLSAMAAAETAIAAGTLADVAQAAREVVANVGNAFVLSALDLARQNRLMVRVPDEDPRGIPVVAMHGQEISILGDADDVGHACDLMVIEVEKEASPCRVGIGVGGREAFEFYGELRRRLEVLDVVSEIIDYRCGPTVGAFSGPGVAGLAWTPLTSSVAN